MLTKINIKEQIILNYACINQKKAVYLYNK